MSLTIETARPFLGAAAAALLLLAAPGAPRAQAGDSELARRTFLNAEQLLREGKVDQAMRDYQQVVQAFPESDFADDALMRLGSNEYPTESISGLGTVGERSQEAARPFFEQIRERYPQSDQAPHALYKLGLLALEPSAPARNLDEAYASFSRVVNIYPDSDWVGRAHLGASYSELAKGSYDRAILAAERALEATYGKRISSEAHFFLGVSNARMGEFVRAAEAFQRCRERDPEGGFAEAALDWITLIYRTRLLPGSGRPPRHRPVAGFVPRVPGGEDLRGDLSLAVSPRGELLVADPRRGALLTFSRDGTLEGTESWPEPTLVRFDAFGSRIVAGEEGGIRVAGEAFPAARMDGDREEPVEEVAGAWRDSTRRIWILDGKEGELLRYGTDPRRPEVILKDKEQGTRLRAMAAGPEDRLYFLDGKENLLMALEGSALKPVVSGAGPAEFAEPAGLAADRLGNLYVLDSKRKELVVLGPGGDRLSRIKPAEGTSHAFEDPAAVAVGPAGEVYVYDERKRTILKFD